MGKAERPSTASARLRAGLLENDKGRRGARARLVEATSKVAPRRNDLVPRLQLVDRAPGSLTAPIRNTRKLDPAHITEVASSVATLGFCVPIVIDQDGVVLDGVVRLEAAKLLGLSSVLCILAEHLSATERKLLRLAANRLGEKGTWSLPELRLEVEELILEDAPVEITGFELTEIDGMLMDGEDPPYEPGPLDVDPTARAVTQRHDVWLLGPHRVCCEDTMTPDVLPRLMNGALATLVCTDQPYNVAVAGHVTSGDHREFAMASGEMSDQQFDAFNSTWMAATLPHLVDGGVLATFIDWRGLASVTNAAVAVGLSQLNLAVWAKTNAGMGSLYRSQHELFPLFKKGKAGHVNNVGLGRNGRHRSNVWSYAGASSLGSDARRGLRHHPTVKPVAMLVDALHDLTHRGDVVLDPFLGSGSTLLAAEKSGRVCYGVEIDPLYVDLIVTRYEGSTGHSAVLDGTGQTFSEVQQARHAQFEPPTG